jgi:uncharacterized repeat protein (TIGR01451 family)
VIAVDPADHHPESAPASHRPALAHDLTEVRLTPARTHTRPAPVLLLPALLALLSALSGPGGAAASGVRAAGSAPRYSVIDLTPEGFWGGSAVAADLNDLGQVTGTLALTSGDRTTYQAFRTAPFRRIDPDADLLGRFPGGTVSYGWAINNSGQVAGDATTSDGVYHGFRTGPNAPIAPDDDLSPGPGIESSSSAHGINNSGTVTGTRYISSQAYRAAGRATAETDLGTLFPDPANPGRYLGTSVASAINDSGHVIGHSSAPDHAQKAFCLTGERMTAADELTGPEGGVLVTGLNNLDQVVGMARFGEETRAFLADPESGIGAGDDLGTLGGTSSLALGINDAGQVVGRSEALVDPGEYPHRAFLWEGGVMKDLNDLIPAGSGWELFAATSINNNGHILVGEAARNGVLRRAVLLVPYAHADLSVRVSHHPDPALVGRDLRFTVTVRNEGPEAARDLVIQADLPANATFVSASPGVTPEDGRLEWSVAGLSPGEEFVGSYVVTPREAGAVATSARVTGSVTDDNEADNEAEDRVEAVPPPGADLQLRMDVLPKEPTTADPITYHLTVRNRGPEKATGVVLEDELPMDAMDLLSVRVSQGSTTVSSSTVKARLGAIKKGGTATVTLVAHPTTSGRLVNQASVDANEADPDRANNAARAAIEVKTAYRPDLVVETFTRHLRKSKRGGASHWVLYLQAVVTNRSEEAESRPTTQVDFLLSQDAELDAGDTPLFKSQGVPILDTYARTKLAARRGYRLDKRVRRNAENTGSVLKGQYLIAVVDPRNRVKELREDNNLFVERLP